MPDRDDLDEILRLCGNYTVPTPDEERALLLRARSGDHDAREALVMRNMRYVIKIAMEQTGYGYPLGDLVPDAVEALTRAIDKFDTTRTNEDGTPIRLSTYATFWMRQAVERKRKANTAHRAYTDSLDRFEVDEVPISERIEDPAASFETEAENRVDVAVLLDRLTPLEREAITLHYGLGDRPPMTLRDMASVMRSPKGRRYSHEWIRKIVNGALTKMRADVPFSNDAIVNVSTIEY